MDKAANAVAVVRSSGGNHKADNLAGNAMAIGPAAPLIMYEMCNSVREKVDASVTHSLMQLATKRAVQLRNTGSLNPYRSIRNRHGKARMT